MSEGISRGQPSGAASAPQAAVVFDHFSLAFRQRKGAIEALKDVCLRVEPGEFITIIGPSGCGKTTLLRAVAGLLVQGEDDVRTGGFVQVLGMTPAEAKARRTFAFTFQNPVLLPWRNVRKNVALPLEIAQDKDEVEDPRIGEMLSMVGIADFSSSMSAQLSGGMQQRVNLARALIQEPKILLMDEPFGSLDEVTRERLNFELLRIQRLKRQTILFVTHSLNEAVLLADRVVVMSKRPAAVREVIPIELGQARSEETLVSSEYIQFVRKVREVFTREEAAP